MGRSRRPAVWRLRGSGAPGLSRVSLLVGSAPLLLAAWPQTSHSAAPCLSFLLREMGCGRSTCFPGSGPVRRARRLEPCGTGVNCALCVGPSPLLSSHPTVGSEGRPRADSRRRVGLGEASELVQAHRGRKGGAGPLWAHDSCTGAWPSPGPTRCPRTVTGHVCGDLGRLFG